MRVKVSVSVLCKKADSIKMKRKVYVNISEFQWIVHSTRCVVDVLGILYFDYPTVRLNRCIRWPFNVTDVLRKLYVCACSIAIQCAENSSCSPTLSRYFAITLAENRPLWMYLLINYHNNGDGIVCYVLFCYVTF